MLRLVTALALLAATALAQDEEEVPESGDVSPFALAVLRRKLERHLLHLAAILGDEGFDRIGLEGSFVR